MKKNRKVFVRLGISAALCLVTAVALVKHSSASIGSISKADLSGNWQLTLYGTTGCGAADARLVTFTLNGSGSATNANSSAHTSGCGDFTLSGDTFTVFTLNSNGAGTAGLSCGPNCGWQFNIQVSPDRSSFSLLDTKDPGNFLIGTAVHQ